MTKQRFLADLKFIIENAGDEGVDIKDSVIDIVNLIKDFQPELTTKQRQNYSSAVLIAWKLWCKFMGSINFNEFEELITDNYNYLDAKVGTK